MKSLVDRTPLPRAHKTPCSHEVIEVLIAMAAFVSVLAIALIFVFVGKEAAPLLGEISLGELFLPHAWEGYDGAVYVWQPVSAVPKMSILPLFVGTAKVTILAMIVSVPLAMGAAIFVAEVLPRRARNFVKGLIEMLAGVPSVVLGFVALAVLADVTHTAFGTVYRLNALVAALALSLTVIPLVFTIVEDSLAAVPSSLRQGALALGARRWQTTLKIVVPAAMPGIFAAIVLGFGRAVGETMIVLMASGNAPVMRIFDPTSSARTVTATIAAELGEVPAETVHWRVLFLLGAMLFVVTFVLNAAGTVAIKQLDKKLRGRT